MSELKYVQGRGLVPAEQARTEEVLTSFNTKIAALRVQVDRIEAKIDDMMEVLEDLLSTLEGTRHH